MRTRGLILKICCASVLCFCLAGCDYVRSLPLCDFFRTLAGRPTSEEIASKKAAIDVINAAKARNERLARIADSLAVADSLASLDGVIVDSLKAEGCLSRSKNKIVWSSDTQTDSLARKFYIMVGAFSVKENAEKLMDTAAAAGYEPVLIRFGNGFHAVALNGSDSAREISVVFDSVRKEKFCPEGAWILSE